MFLYLFSLNYSTFTFVCFCFVSFVSKTLLFQGFLGSVYILAGTKEEYQNWSCIISQNGNVIHKYEIAVKLVYNLNNLDAMV